MKQTEWKIVYTKYGGVVKSAVHLLSREVGALLLREPEVYRIFVLPCEREGCQLTKNVFLVGTYDQSMHIQSLLERSEIPEDGFLVKIVPNPECEGGRFVILTAHTDRELFYAVVSFLDDYIPQHAPVHGANRMPDLIFDSPLPLWTYAESPDNKTRSIFTWGHSINDYRAYLNNMARMKFNEIIIWNDHVPLNIGDVIDYAHALGIKIILGYAWGWIEGCQKITDISEERLHELKRSIIEQYDAHYADTGCDGIYFQSFTERGDEYIGGRLIAEAVTTLVNMTAAELLEKKPSLRLQFGLHAPSVRHRLAEIAKVDERVEILWEDCGEFPYDYRSFVASEKAYEQTLAFTKELLELRGGVGVGLVFKGVMMLDWTRFVNQRGPYILGESTQRLAEHDRRIRANAWREYAADWMAGGDRAAQMLRFIKQNKRGEVNMCLAGTFDGGMYLPVALCAQMYRSCDEEFSAILKRVSRRGCINVD